MDLNNLQPDNAKAQILSNAVAYADKSVVSKQLLKAPSGNITLFAFDKGEGLSEHTAPFDAFVEILDGKAEITIGGIKHSLTTGQFIIMPANVPHALSAVEKFKMMLVMIKS
ncbi:MAG TPA: cupin domain-containing protein [Bacteroidales bacterium]